MFDPESWAILAQREIKRREMSLEKLHVETGVHRRPLHDIVNSRFDALTIDQVLKVCAALKIAGTPDIDVLKLDLAAELVDLMETSPLPVHPPLREKIVDKQLADLPLYRMVNLKRRLTDGTESNG